MRFCVITPEACSSHDGPGQRRQLGEGKKVALATKMTFICFSVIMPLHIFFWPQNGVWRMK